MVPPPELSRRVALLALAGAALAACGTSASRQDAAPVDFARPVAALPPIAAGQGRIVVMREDWATASGPSAEVQFNGRPAGTIADGKLLARDVAPGVYVVGVAQGAFGELGVTEVTVEVRPGATAYVRMVYFVADRQAAASGLAPSASARRSDTQLNRAGGLTLTRARNFRFAELSGPPR